MLYLKSGDFKGGNLKMGLQMCGVWSKYVSLREDIHKFKIARLINLIEKRHKSNFQMVGISRVAILKWGWQ
jgi:hypothetical protein